MRRHLLVLTAFAISTVCVARATVAAPRQSPQTNDKEVVVFDTDMGSDCDDVGALALLHHYVSRGDAEILCCIYSSSTIPFGVGVIDAINTFYGRPDIPIGANRAGDVGDPVDKMKAEQLARQTDQFGHNLVTSADVEEDVKLLRRLLAKQADNSVTYITVGHTRSLHDLLISDGDEASPLSGKQLVSSKLKRWIALGALGANNAQGHSSKDWNFFRNGTSKYTEYLVRNMPVPSVFINAGSDVLTGKALKQLPCDSIVRVAYETWLDNVQQKSLDDQRPSWDLVAVYYAFEGIGDFLYEEEKGYLQFDKEQGSKWVTTDGATGHTYICQREGVNRQFGDLLNTSIASSPKKTRVLLDSDANNELDDQHAIAYLLLNGGVFTTEAITVNTTRNGGGIEEQAAEAERIVKLCNLERSIPVLRGADGSFDEIKGTLDQEDFDGADAVNFIIKKSLESAKDKLILLPVGKLTNIALALKKQPAIAEHVRIVWLGSNYPDPGEYNQDNDEGALNFVLDCDVPLEIALVRYGKPSGTAAVRVTPNEIRKIVGKGPRAAEPVIGRHGGAFSTFGDYAINLFEHIDLHGDPPARALFDMAAVAIVKNPAWATARVIPAPRLVDGQWRERPNNPRKITLWENFDRDAIVADFFNTITNPIAVNPAR